MTAIGVIAEPHQAIIWADTLFFIDGVPAGHKQKLVVNTTAKLAGCGTGIGSICAAGREAAAAARDIHHLVDMLPRALSAVAYDLVAERGAGANVFIVAGWSSRWRRMIACRFAGPPFHSEPILSYTSPQVDTAGYADAALDDVTGTVQTQIADLARRQGCQITGQVTGARISRDQIATRTLLELGGSAPLELEQRRGAMLSTSGAAE